MFAQKERVSSADLDFIQGYLAEYFHNDVLPEDLHSLKKPPV